MEMLMAYVVLQHSASSVLLSHISLKISQSQCLSVHGFDTHTHRVTLLIKQNKNKKHSL